MACTCEYTLLTFYCVYFALPIRRRRNCWLGFCNKYVQVVDLMDVGCHKNIWSRSKWDFVPSLCSWMSALFV